MRLYLIHKLDSLAAIPNLTTTELNETIQDELNRLERNHYLSKDSMLFLRKLFEECEVRMK